MDAWFVSRANVLLSILFFILWARTWLDDDPSSRIILFGLLCVSVAASIIVDRQFMKKAYGGYA